MNKVHYKMFKAGKKWMVAGIVTAAMSTGAFFVTSINANADVVSNASGYTGTPYSYGGNDASGIDCSALVQNAYAADGVSLPRTSGAQYGATTQISAADAQPGDLVFFGNQGSDHVGIYSGNGNMINAETVDGVTSRQVSVMEKYLGTATYGRVNGGAQSAAVNSNVADTTQSSDNTPAADTSDQAQNVTAANSQTDTDNDTMILAPAPKVADNQTDSTPDSDTTTPAAPVANDAAQTTTQSDNIGHNGLVTPTDTTPVAQNDVATTDDATPVAQNDAATTDDATPVAQNDAATADTTPVAQTTTATTPATDANTIQNDNVVTLNKTAPTSVQSNADASNVTAAPATTTSNKKAALPATGQSNNSLLSIVGLVLISFVAMFGIKLRKNN